MPKITARVVNPFKENAHKGHIYAAGDVYPAAGFIADETRVQFLTEKHPKYKKVYLSDVTMEKAKTKNVNEGYPKHMGGGKYELSNGEKVQGKAKALEAQNEVNRGE